MRPNTTPLIACALLLLCLPTSSLAVAPPDSEADWETSISLLTIAPGDHLFSRFGHTAFLVLHMKPGSKAYRSEVYNFGDADFRAAGFKWRFFRGTAEFYLSTMGNLNRVVNLYAHDNRTIYHQNLALTPAQVRTLERRLREGVAPGKREYVYHHLTAGCGSKARDLLDEVVGGAIKRTLDHENDPHTTRYYGRKGYAGLIYAEVCNDLFMGRLHDVPHTKYFTMYLPERMSTYLTQVLVPDPRGSGKQVPLASAPSVLFKRRGPPPTIGTGRTLIYLSYFWIAVIVGLGVYALAAFPRRPRRCGLWLLFWSVPAASATIMMLFGAVCSTVIEGRINELMLSFPIADVALVAVGLRWLRGRCYAGRAFRVYLALRLGLLAVVLMGHAVGLLYQEPRVLVLLSLVANVFLVAIARKIPRTAAEPAHLDELADAHEPSPSAPPRILTA